MTGMTHKAIMKIVERSGVEPAAWDEMVREAEVTQ